MCTLSSSSQIHHLSLPLKKTKDFLSRHDFQVHFGYNFLWGSSKLYTCHTGPPKCQIPISIFFLFVTRRTAVKLFNVLKSLGKWEIIIYDFRISNYMWSTLMSVCQTCTLMKIFALSYVCLRHNMTSPWCSY